MLKTYHAYCIVCIFFSPHRWRREGLEQALYPGVLFSFFLCLILFVASLLSDGYTPCFFIRELWREWHSGGGSSREV